MNDMVFDNPNIFSLPETLGLTYSHQKNLATCLSFLKSHFFYLNLTKKF